LIPSGSERAFRNGVFGIWFSALFSFAFARLSLFGHIVFWHALFSILRRTRIYALFDHQDTVFYGPVHGFTFDESASEAARFWYMDEGSNNIGAFLAGVKSVIWCE